MILLLMFLMVLAVVLGCGHVLVKRWTRQEIERRKRRARLVTASIDSSATENGGNADAAQGSKDQPVGGSSHPFLKLPDDKAKHLAMTAKQGAVFVEDLRREMELVHEAACGAQAADRQFYWAKEAYEAACGRLGEDSDPPTADPECFHRAVTVRIDRVTAAKEKESALFSSHRDLSAGIEKLSASLAVFCRRLKRLASHKASVLPAPVAIARLLGQQLRNRLEKQLEYLEQNEHDARKFVRGIKPLKLPTAADTPLLQALATEVSDRVHLVLSAWREAEQAAEAWRLAERSYRDALSAAERFGEPSEAHSLEGKLVRSKDNHLLAIQRRSQLIALVAPLQAAASKVDQALGPLVNVIQRLKGYAVLPQKLEAMRYVLVGWQSRLERRCRMALAETIKEVVGKTATPEQSGLAPERLDKLLADAAASLKSVATVLFSLQGPMDTCARRMGEWQESLSWRRPPQLEKPVEAEVARHTGKCEEWAVRNLAAQRAAFAAREEVQLRLKVLDGHCGAFFQGMSEIERELMKKLAPSAEAQARALVCARVWLATKQKEVRESVAAWMRHPLDGSKPNAEVGEKDAARMAELRKKARSLGFAVAQVVASQEKEKRTLAMEMPQEPPRPKLPEHTAPVDFAQLIDGMDAFLGELALVTERRNQIKAQQDAARQATEARLSKRKEILAGLEEAANQASASLTDNSADELRVLIGAARKLCELHH